MKDKTLELTGFSAYADVFQPRQIKLRDGTNAILWINTINGHGILDCDYWPSKEDYNNEYRKNVGANLNLKNSSQEHFDTYRELNKRQFDQMKFVIDEKQKNLSVLEIGSSFGGIISNMINYGVSDITAVEPNYDDCLFMSNKFSGTTNLTIINNFFEEYEGDKKFDLVCCFEVLEHIINPRSFIEKIKQSLNVNGKIHIEVPNHSDFLTMNLAYRDFFYHKYHIHYFSKESLLSLLGGSGCSCFCEGFQMYSFWNFLHWIDKNSPQDSAQKALGSKNTNNNEFNILLNHMDSVYKDVLKNNSISDCIVLKGEFQNRY